VAFPFGPLKGMDQFASLVAPFTLLLPETIPVCTIGEPIASISAGLAWAASQRDFVGIGLFHYAGCKKENHERACAHQKHWQKTTNRHNPLPITPEPIRSRHGRRWRSRFHE